VPQPKVGVQKSLMLLVNSHILKIVAMLKNTEYNRRAAIIEGLRARRSATEIIGFLNTQDQLFMTLWQNTALEQSNEGSSSNRNASEEVTRKNAPRR